MRKRLGRFVALLLLAPAGRAAADDGVWTVDRLVAELRAAADEVQASPAVRADFERVAQRHALATDASMLRQYLRVKTVYEATREAGWWRIGWSVTDRPPQSDAIWRAWRGMNADAPRVTAIAECDELSALSALLLRRIGVPSVGLFWPMPNHTVAVWKIKARDGREARIVLPTSQVFLDPLDGFDTTAFNAAKQKIIYDYTRSDVKGSDVLPSALTRFLVRQARRYAAASDMTQRRLRVLRSRHMAGEPITSIERERRLVSAGLSSATTDPDHAAVEAFGLELSGN